MSKFIASIAIIGVMLSGFWLAADQRTWGQLFLSTADDATSVTSATKKTVAPVPMSAPVIMRWTPGAWGIGVLGAIKVNNPSMNTQATSEVTETDVEDTPSEQEVFAEEIINNTQMPTVGVWITEPYPDAWLAHTGAAQRNAFYLLISLFGIVGLMGVMRKEQD